MVLAGGALGLLELVALYLAHGSKRMVPWTLACPLLNQCNGWRTRTVVRQESGHHQPSEVGGQDGRSLGRGVAGDGWGR